MKPGTGGQSNRTAVRLLALNPPDSSAREFLLLKDLCAIGSDESNDLVLRHPTVSRRHAGLRRVREFWELTDLGSTNGTFVNGRRVDAPLRVAKGDDLRFGAIRFVFSSPSAEPATGPLRSRTPKRRWLVSLRTLGELVLIAFVIGFAGAQVTSYFLYREQAKLILLAKAVPLPSPPAASSTVGAPLPDEGLRVAATPAPGRSAASRTTPRAAPTSAAIVANKGSPAPAPAVAAAPSPTSASPPLLRPTFGADAQVSKDTAATLALTSLYLNPTGNFAGQSAPDFVLPTLAGDEASLSSSSGKVVLLNFWATWCPACRSEMPSLEALYKDLSRNPEFSMLTVLTGDRSSPSAVAAFMNRNGYTFPVALDPNGAEASQYRVGGIPATFVIDPNGKVLWNVTGAINWSDPRLRAALRKAL